MSMAILCEIPVIKAKKKKSLRKKLFNLISKMILNKRDRCDVNVDLSIIVEELGQQLYPGAWHRKPAMSGCSTSCPNCKHEFTCCPPASVCCINKRRAQKVLSGGGLINQPPPTPVLAPTTCCCGGGGANSSPCPSPQISPSTPLAFIIPPFPAVGLAPHPHPFSPLPSMASLALPPLPTPKHHQAHQLQLTTATTTTAPALVPLLALPAAFHPDAVRPENELRRLGDIELALRQSGWYYEGISYKTSDELLRNTEVGTFLVRNSADPRYLYSLSMRTDRSPSSVRLCYANGYFRLEARQPLQAGMPLFPGVVELVEYYVSQFRYNSQVWMDPQGKYYSAMVLTKPLRKRPPDLKHLARLAIHKQLQAARPRVRAVAPQPHTQLELPTSVEAYLAEYPYSV